MFTNCDRISSVFWNKISPSRCLLKACTFCTVVKYHHAISISEVLLRDRMKSFLSCSIPKLQVHLSSLIINIKKFIYLEGKLFRFEFQNWVIYSYCTWCDGIEVTRSNSSNKGSFSCPKSILKQKWLSSTHPADPIITTLNFRISISGIESWIPTISLTEKRRPFLSFKT